jgi:PKD repeat protein
LLGHIGTVRTAHRAFLVAAITLFTATAAPAAATTAASPRLAIEAPRTVAAGQPIHVSVAVDGARNLAGFQAALRLDPAAARIAGVDLISADLGRTGRGVLSLGPEELPSGVAFGSFTCPTTDCLTRAGRRHAVGVDGRVRLADVTVLPLRTGRLAIAIDNVRLVDASGDRIALATPASARVMIGVGPGAASTFSPAHVPHARPRPMSAQGPDVNADGLVTISDAMDVANAWLQAQHTPARCLESGSRAFDVNGDGCITVDDAQLVASASSPRGALRPAVTVAGRALSTPQSPLALVVTGNGDGGDALVGDGVCLTKAGVCTLRAAIQEADRHSGPDSIAFAIPGTGIKTIALKRALPPLDDDTGGTTIDGYTQAGAAANTDPAASNARIRVQVKGAGEFTGWSSIVVTAPHNTIRGISIFRSWRAISLLGLGAYDTAIVGSFVGTNANATYRSPTFNAANGALYLNSGANHNLIGSPTNADRILVSGSPATGVYFNGQGTNGNIVRNAIVGLSPSGNASLTNLLEGIDLNGGSSYNIIGGTGAGQRNVVSGNTHSGIEVSHGTNTIGNRIVGNFVGTLLSGNGMGAWTANVDFGVHVEDGVQDTYVADNVIGNSLDGGMEISGFTQGTSRGTVVERNRIGIALNGSPIPNKAAGIVIEHLTNTSRIGPANIITNNPVGIILRDATSHGDLVTANSIYANKGLGIDIYPRGVTPNDFGDLDTGADQLLNFPVLSAVTPSLAQGSACASCQVEVFLSDGGARAFGEGQTLLGSGRAGVDGRFAVALTGAAVGAYVTATASDPAGDTSEFSLDHLVTSVAFPPGTVVAADQFGRALSAHWGQAGTGGFWSVYAAASSFNVSGGWGTLTASTGQTRQVGLLSSRVRDVDVTLRIMTNAQPVGGSQTIDVVARQADLGDEYRVHARMDPGGHLYLSAARVIGGTETSLGPEKLVAGLSVAPGTPIRLRAKVIGGGPTTIMAKAWLDGQSEPAQWLLTASDASSQLTPPGAIGLRAYVNSASTAGTVQFGFDDLNAIMVPGAPAAAHADFGSSQDPSSLTMQFSDASSGDVNSWQWSFGDGATSTLADPSHVYAASGTYSVMLTVSGPGGSDSKTASVQVVDVPPPPPATYASDSFERTVAQGWGTAPIGGAWSGAGLGATDSVSNQAISTVNAGSTRDEFLFSVFQRDVDALLTVSTDKLPQGANDFVYLTVRQTSPDSDYAAKLWTTPDGKVMLGLSRFDGSGETVLASGLLVAGVTGGPGSAVSVRFEAIGANNTTLRARAWNAADSEPSSWLVSATDGTAGFQGPGAVGVRSHVPVEVVNGPITFSYDDYEVVAAP